MKIKSVWKFFCPFTFFVFLLVLPHPTAAVFDAVLGRYIISQFERQENSRLQEAASRGENGLDMNFASSSPFITANGFRSLCYPYVVDYNYTLSSGSQCNLSSTMFKAVPNGACIYIASACFEKVVTSYLPLIPQTYTLVVHDGDQSIPDGQMDYKSGWLRQFETFPRLSRLHSQGKLIALHTQNLWWRSWKTSPRPNWLHCLPIGLEMRKYNHGSNLTVYLEVIREIVDFASTSLVRSHKKRPLLLVAFTPKPYAPDRGKALLSFFGKKQSFYTKKSYNHRGWLRAITQHRFTLCPFGHGLDTHRLWEVLLLGGIPVVRRSSITSCIDDSDNIIHVPLISSSQGDTGNFTEFARVKRGSIPIVVVDSWSEVTETFLEKKWKHLRHMEAVTGGWDYSRVLLKHWEGRIVGRNIIENTYTTRTSGMV